MSFCEELKKWIDEDSLVGASENPGKWSTGNAILETATAGVIIHILKDKAGNLSERAEVLRILQKGIKGCQLESGIFNKNPGRPDDITHDDLIGAATFSALYDPSIVKKLVEFGEKTGWIMSNTGKVYFNSIARKWHIVFYKLCAGRKVDIFDKIIFGIYLLLPSDHSGERLKWLQVEAVGRKSFLLELFSFLWKLKIKRKYRYISELLRKYYNRSDHIFVKYCEG